VVGGLEWVDGLEEVVPPEQLVMMISAIVKIRVYLEVFIKNSFLLQVYS
jgi:hypothetical protein